MLLEPLGPLSAMNLIPILGAQVLGFMVHGDQRAADLLSPFTHLTQRQCPDRGKGT